MSTPSTTSPHHLVAPAADAPLVLHVTEAMGGGLEDAVNDFIRSAPQYRHALLFTRRGDYATGQQRPDLVEVVDAGRGFRSLQRAYGPTVRRLQPDVIHLHSAWAGLIGRLGTAGPRRAPLVYSPHSYYFDRRDLPRPVRGLARLLEHALSGRTALTAAVSPFEAATARALGSAAHCIPNVVRLPEDLRWTGSGEREVLVVGRVTAQKDPAFLLAMLPHLPRDVRITWVGSGAPGAEEKLRAAGVRVTGWVPRAECLAMMVRADAYLHTAAWEGSPITLLEAAAIGVPIVARAIPALDSLGFDGSLRTPRAVAAALAALLDGGPAPASPPAADPRLQREAIGLAYGRVLPRRPEPAVPALDALPEPERPAVPAPVYATATVLAALALEQQDDARTPADDVRLGGPRS